MPLEISTAKKIYSSFVDFARRELAASNGDLKNANSVARLNGFVVSAATDDSIHKLVRGSDQKDFNRTTQTMFKQSIVTLFGKEDVSELPQTVQDALKTLSAETRPLSARRIHIVSAQVNIALMSEKGSNPVVDRIRAMGSAVNGIMKGTRDLAAVKTHLTDAFAAITSDAAALNDALVNTLLASVNGAVEGAETYEDLVSRLSETLEQVTADVERAAPEPGTSKCVAAYGIKQVVSSLIDELKKSAYLMKIDTVRTNIDALKTAHAKEPTVLKFLEKLEGEASDASLKTMNFAEFEVDRLEMLASEDYISLVNTQVARIVTDTIRAEKKLIQESYDRQGDKTHDELMPEAREGEVSGGLEAEAKEAAWTRQADPSAKGVDTKKIGGGFHASQDKFVKDVHAKIESDVRSAVAGEKQRVDDAAKEIKITLLSEEDEKKFIEDMCEEYAKVAWNQVKTTGKIELPTAKIEDAYARAYSKGLKSQGDNIIKTIVDDLEKAMAETRQNCANDINTIIGKGNASAGEARKTLNRQKSELRAAETKVGTLKAEIKALEQQLKATRLDYDEVSKTTGIIAFFKRDSQLVELKDRIGGLEKDLKSKQKDLKSAEGEVGEIKSTIKLNREALAILDKTHADINRNGNAFIGQAQEALKDLEDAKGYILDQLSSGKTIDIASLRDTVKSFKAEAAKLTKTLASFSVENAAKFEGVAKPESFNINSRFGLHDPENFTRRVEVGAKGFLKGLVQASELDAAVKATLEKVLDNTFGEKTSIPEKFVSIGRERLNGQTNEDLAKIEIENGIELYVKCVIDGVKAGSLKLDPSGTLPDLAATEVKAFAEEELVRERQANLTSKIPLLGNDRKYQGALNVLRNFGTDGVRLAGEIEKLLPLFNRSAASATYGSGEFDRNYQTILLQKVDAPHSGGTDVRSYLAKLLTGIARSNDASDLEASSTVIGNAKTIVKLLGTMVESAEKEAYAKTLDGLGETVRALVGFDGLTTLDKETLQSAFLRKTGLSAEEFAGLDATAIGRIRSFMAFVDTTFTNMRAFATAFIRSLAAKDFPVSLLNDKSKELLERLVALKLAADTRGALVSGFGTYDAGEILKALSQDGLLNLTCEEHTVKVLSLLYRLNGAKAGGLNSLADEVFAKGIADITESDYTETRFLIGENQRDKLPPLFGVGKYAAYTTEADFRTFIKSSERIQSLAALLEGGIEPLFANADKKNPAPKVADIRAWIKAMDILDANGKATIRLNNTDVQLARLDNGNVEATLVGEKGEIVRKYLAITPKAIAAQLLETIFRHAESFVEESRGEVLTALDDAKPSEVRRCAILVLTRIAANKKFGTFDSVRLAGVPTVTLRAVAEGLIKGSLGKDAFLAALNVAEDAVYSQEVHDSLDRLRAAEASLGKEKLDQVVKAPEVRTPMVQPSTEKIEVINREMARLQDEFTTRFVNTLSSPKDSSTYLTSLKELAGAESIDMTSGYGAFLKKFMTNYFAKMSELDKRVLFAAVKGETGADATPHQRIASLVRNSGPVFLKMLQGIPAGAVSAEFRDLMSEIKDSLPPIATDIVRSQLLDIVERSNGQITGIEVKESLGAASVGEALLCRIRTVSNPDGEDVVVKLLRPNVQNFARREIDFIHNELRDTSFDGRLEGILKELDLTLESDNVELGRAYDTIQPPGTIKVEMNRVVSMQLDPIARPSVMSAVIRKAPGVTCEKFFKGVETKLDEILSSFKHGKHYKTASLQDFVMVKDELLHLYSLTKARQEDLFNLAYKWAAYALFPKGDKDGFVHGDLHDGNIMTDERSMTLIDFGNAMKLTVDQRQSLIATLVYCGLGKGHGKDFVGHLEELGLKLGKSSKVNDAIYAELDEAFSKGTANDTGLRFAAAIKILQKHQVEIPAVVNNFAQSLLRLQNAIERANGSLRKIEGLLRGLKYDTSVASEAERHNPLRMNVFDKDASPLHMMDPSNDSLTIMTSSFLAEMSEDGKLANLLAGMCKDKDGKFSVRAVEENLLRNLAPFKAVYMCNSNVNVAIPPLEDRPGYKLYQKAEELKYAEFDLDNEVDVPRFNKFIADLSEGLLDVFVYLQSGVIANVDGFKTTVSKNSVKAFSAALQKCICDHSQVCRTAVGSKIGLIPAGFLLTQIQNSGALSEEEQKAILKISKLDTKFMVAHPDLPIDVLRRTSEVTNTEFVHEFETFAKGWGSKDALLRRGASILAHNVGHLKAALAREGMGLDKAELQQALDLSVVHLKSRFHLGDSMKTLTAAQFAKFVSYLGDADSEYVARRLFA